MSTPQRRATDFNDQNEIERLIADEQDPKVRLQLMVMNRINLSLIANTETIHDVARKLDTHLTEFENHTKNESAMLNQGKGMAKVGIAIAGLLQAVSVGLWYDYRQGDKEVHAYITADIARHAVLEQRVSELEKGK